MKISIKIFLLFLSFNYIAFSQNNSPVVIGSKKFTESVILGELIKLSIESNQYQAIHNKQLGGTRVLWNALLNGDIDIYPEYTGTITFEIFGGTIKNDWNTIKSKLDEYSIGISKPLGFNNTYAIGMKTTIANKLNISQISDLINYPDLKLGFSNEVIDRADGWKYWKKKYNLPQKNVIGLDHDLAYRGLDNEDIFATDLYSTDAEIKYYNLKILEDDKNIFPKYYAVYLYRKPLNNKFNVFDKIQPLIISESEMIAMNEAVKINKISEGEVAKSFLQRKYNINVKNKEQSFFTRLVDRTMEHLTLFGISMLCAVILSIPLGIIAAKHIKSGQIILGIAGIFQTIPSLALLVFMIPLLGIGEPPAIVALFLYSLLPIIRNTHSGLKGISPEIIDSADALGLNSFAKLTKIELPIALSYVISGIKISAVINIGTATLGALIGAGGYGQPILTGIRLDDIFLILEGAVPAALLAIVIQYIFEFIEKAAVSKGLQ